MRGTAFKITPQQNLVGTVVSIEDFAGPYGPSYNVDVDSGGTIFRVTEKREKIDEQFLKIGLNRQTAIGRVLNFWKKPMADDPKKGYLNIDAMDTGRAPIGTGPLAAAAATVVGHIGGNTVATTPAATNAVPAWLDPEARAAQAREQMRSDLTFGWKTALEIMGPFIEKNIGLGDPTCLQPLQAMAVAIAIRLEKAR